MKKIRNLKRANGKGGVVYLGANRRRPYGARITVGYNDKGIQQYEYIGYGEDEDEANLILINYNKEPYSLNYKDIKVKEVYNKLEPIMFKDIGKPGMSKSNYDNLTSSYKNHLKDIYEDKIIEVQKNRLQKIIDNSGLKHTGRGYIKNIWERLVTFANEELGLKINEEVYNLKVGNKEDSDMHQVIDYNKIPIIEQLANKGNDIAKIIMIYLYSSWRPSELLDIENANVFLDNDYMVGGKKTKAGKNRPMPIHSKVKPYVEYFYNSNNKYLITDKLTGKHMTYDSYQNQFENLMVELGLNYIPGDTRKTFATRCSELHIPDPIIKRLMGHSLKKDVTNDVYVDMKIERLKAIMETFYY